ncbi:nucleoside 2-deoxyribosyltransferase domain-containing protein [Streptomyces sp. NBRC 109706]|uniref:nucleoside 2-deoxyribosyltransferase domain-containing protein n=1 Tax=Streptomyces sp. NBRC 109706 TaxID=1550035 RepID=UPI0008304FD0|nr:nucleoside 2-deoxyribosyltransferase domain-containing protein [Streptomyces sp. NBRC 109706]
MSPLPDPWPVTPNLRIIWAREPLPAPGASPTVFIAGPTPRAGDPVDSWRPEAIRELSAQWPDDGPELTVLTPESRGGIRAAHYDDQVEWEHAARADADVIVFWIPRDLRTLPGMTTNVEYGYDIASGRRVVLGCPPDCPNPERNRYLIHLAGLHGVPVRHTLPDTITTAIKAINQYQPSAAHHPLAATDCADQTH